MIREPILVPEPEKGVGKLEKNPNNICRTVNFLVSVFILWLYKMLVEGEVR